MPPESSVDFLLSLSATGSCYLLQEMDTKAMLKSALEGRFSHIGDGGSLGQNGNTYSRQRPCCEKSQSLAQQDVLTYVGCLDRFGRRGSVWGWGGSQVRWTNTRNLKLTSMILESKGAWQLDLPPRRSSLKQWNGQIRATEQRRLKIRRVWPLWNKRKEGIQQTVAERPQQAWLFLLCLFLCLTYFEPEDTEMRWTSEF